MSYQALYRRYRPARFSDFVGQEAVIRTLKSQVTSGRIAHAYLFCGTRGTGKTSAAKVFARAVNCLHPEDGEPCGTCEVCRALAGEGSLDILEIDAASNNGVDEIRDLREKVKYPPQSGRYRVYIVDEVHMLSAGAFNALLKTLEEPPAYVVFILATTEPQRLPATILSRCQRFDFGRIPAQQIAARLKQALEEDGVPCEDAALARIARAAEGGMRDAWSILDMALGYAQEDGRGVTEALVLHVLGAADRQTLFRFADALIGADARAALTQIDETLRAGREAQVFARDVSAHLRALMLADVCGEEHAAELLETTQEDALAYVQQARRTSHARLMRMLDLFLQSETDMKWSAQPRFALESAALRACEPEEALQLEALAVRVDELERRLREGVAFAAPQTVGSAAQTFRDGDGHSPSATGAQVGSPAQSFGDGNGHGPSATGANAGSPAQPFGDGNGHGPSATGAQAGNAAQPFGEGSGHGPSATGAQAGNAAQPFGDGSGHRPQQIWQEALRRLKQDPRIFGIARFGRLASCEDGLFTVVFDKTSGGMYVRLLNADEKRAQMEAALTAAAGFPCTFRAAIEGTVKETDAGVLAAQADAERQAKKNLDKVFAAFGRENVRVEHEGMD